MPRKVIVVTGGAKRIGAAVAEFFHARDYLVAIHYRHSEQEANALAQKLNHMRINSCLLLKADFSAADIDYKTLIAPVIEQWGHINVLFNNASSFFPTKLQALQESEWNELINSNLKSPLFLSQACQTALQKQGGCIINMLDINIKSAPKNFSIYGAAKAGLAYLNTSLAKELAPHIRVNAISPGNILWAEHEALNDNEKQQRLKNIPLERQGTTLDIAKTAWFLAENAPYITGQNINVDGGKSLI